MAQIMKTTTTSLMLISITLSGCAHINSRSFAYENESASQLYVWNAEYSAGIGASGKFCVESAKVAKARNADGSITTTTQQNATINYGEDVIVLDPGNAQTTFASSAYFALCQIAANTDKLSATQIESMFNGISKAAANIGHPVIAEKTQEDNIKP